MADIKLTQTQFDAIATLSNQTASIGLVVKKLSVDDWHRLTYVSEGENGNWNITVDKIIIDNRARSKQLADDVLDVLQDALREEVIGGSLTQAQAATLFGTISDVISSLNAGWLRESRVICNSLSTNGILTTGRKNFILARIDEAIALL